MKLFTENLDHLLRTPHLPLWFTYTGKEYENNTFSYINGHIESYLPFKVEQLNAKIIVANDVSNIKLAVKRDKKRKFNADVTTILPENMTNYAIANDQVLVQMGKNLKLYTVGERKPKESKEQIFKPYNVFSQDGTFFSVQEGLHPLNVFRYEANEEVLSEDIHVDEVKNAFFYNKNFYWHEDTVLREFNTIEKIDHIHLFESKQIVPYEDSIYFSKIKNNNSLIIKSTPERYIEKKIVELPQEIDKFGILYDIE